MDPGVRRYDGLKAGGVVNCGANSQSTLCLHLAPGPFTRPVGPNLHASTNHGKLPVRPSCIPQQMCNPLPHSCRLSQKS